MKKLAAVALVSMALFSCATDGRLDGGPAVQAYPLMHVCADQVARTLAGEEKRAAGTVVEIAANVCSNSIVVSGSKEDLARVERRIRELDVP